MNILTLPCPDCSGTCKRLQPCHVCQGRGFWKERTLSWDTWRTRTQEVTCTNPNCVDGVEEIACHLCDGQGELFDVEVEDIREALGG